MASHQVHNGGVALASHTVLHDGLTEDISGIATAAESTEGTTASTETLRNKAVVTHAHTLGLLSSKLAL